MIAYPTIDTGGVASPGLWVDRAAVQRNIDQMIEDVGGTEQIDRLRPHMKTHKMGEVISMQVASGIFKCKAATPMEALVAARNGISDVLLAHQPVGEKIEWLNELIETFPDIQFGTIVDHDEGLEAISRVLANPDRVLSLWIDVDCGMHRSGIPFGEGLDRLRERIETTPGVRFAGLHVYDGHLHDPSLEIRQAEAGAIIATVEDYISSHDVPAIVGGGTPTFPVWAQKGRWECSPGTTFFWDCGYGEIYPDLRYEIAAGLVTRVISKPGSDLVCFDLGHKSVAAEMPLERRLVFPAIPEFELAGQSEEHLVVRVPDSSQFVMGEPFVAIPRHICPTVALHAVAVVLENGEATGETWEVAARNRVIG